MTQVGAPRHDPIPIGDVATPPFVRLPDPATLFAQRAQRLRALAPGHELKSYLLLLADLCAVQHAIQDGLAAAELPDRDALARAREYGMPPLDRSRFTSDAAYAGDRAEMMRAVLADSIPVEAIAEHAFVTAALQVHFARLATQLDAKSLVPVGDGVCPTCGGPPVCSMVVGWQGAHGTRFCACALCGTLWNYVRIKCTVCGSTKGIGYQEIDGGPGTIKAETCDSCRSYVKILHQHKDPSLEPIADDVASLGLDMLVRKR